MGYELVANTGCPPEGAQKVPDSEDLYVAVAQSDYGQIVGKARGDTCWYSYGGKEYYTKDFKWLVGEVTYVKHDGDGEAPDEALEIGCQNDDSGDHYAAIAHTEDWGNIPGKAIEDTCWYPYDDEEHTTSNFSWVCEA